MIRASLSFPSLSLLRPVKIEIGLPQGFILTAPPWPALWCLHCAMSDGGFFFESLNGADYIDKKGFILVAPSLGNGWFANSAWEAQADFLEEIFAALPSLLPIAPDKKRNSVLGVSMGGFGALRWALASGHFANACAISGVFSCLVPPDERIGKCRDQKAIYGAFKKAMRKFLLDESGQVLPEADFEILLKTAKSTYPEIFLFCGERDYLALPQNLAFEALCGKENRPANLCLAPGGHDAACWRFAFASAIEQIFPA